MSIDHKLLGRALDRSLAERGASLRAAASEIGVAAATLSRIRNAKIVPDDKTVLLIANWLGADPADFGVESSTMIQIHFRAAKNANSKVVENLVAAARSLAESYNADLPKDMKKEDHADSDDEDFQISLSKSQMENLAESLRDDLNLKFFEPLDSLKLRIGRAAVEHITNSRNLPAKNRKNLAEQYSEFWSAVSIPVIHDDLDWIILLNDTHTPQRQRVTYLEELWHIMLGHKLTRVVLRNGVYSRDYEDSEEHDAYYLASASLLPKELIHQCIQDEIPSDEIGDRAGVSRALVEYRIKRLGLWRKFKSLSVRLD